MKELIKLGLTLALVCTVAAAVLALVNDMTEQRRRMVSKQALKEDLELVLPDFTNKPYRNKIKVSAQPSWPSATDKVVFYPARRNGEIVGVAGKAVSPNGYGGNVSVLVGLWPDGRVRTVLVSKHQETPGLGTQVTDRKKQMAVWDIFTEKQTDFKQKTGEKGLPPNPYLDQYSGRGPLRQKTLKAASAPFRVKKDGGKIQHISGATVSSRAVAEAVSVVCRAFSEQKTKDRILSRP